MNDGEPTLPVRGDVIVSCGHAVTQWKLLEPRRVALTKIGMVLVRWIAVCDHCYVEAGGDFSRPALRAVGEWKGDGISVFVRPS